MKDQIVEKLRAILSDDIDSESKVVYVLCESRKLLDKYPPDPVPFALKMYCHWALHIDLTNAGTTGALLGRIDDFVNRVVLKAEDVIEDHYLFRELLWLDTFRQQFRELLHAYDLPAELCDEDRRWHEFLTHYAGVIQDGSLSCQAKTQRLKHVSEVIFSRERRRPDAFVPFDLVWEIVLLDGRSIVVDVYATPLPNGKPMMVHGIELRRWNDPVAIGGSGTL
jgi:hypothetical protein